MRVLVEVEIATDEVGEDEELIYEKKEFFLLHWGLDYTLIEMEEGRRIAANFTVAICEDYETGQILCFRPEQLKIIGREIKK